MNGRMVAMDDRQIAMDKRLQRVEIPAADSDSGDEHSEADGKSVESENSATRATGQEVATPNSLRTNLRLMAQAASRLARLEGDEADDDIDQYIPRNRGKKPGSLRVATDLVKHSIDWPHMHVRRMVQGKRKTLAYAELSVEEFVYGFLTMLENPDCKMDMRTMIKLLRILMQWTIHGPMQGTFTKQSDRRWRQAQCGGTTRR